MAGTAVNMGGDDLYVNDIYVGSTNPSNTTGVTLNRETTLAAGATKTLATTDANKTVLLDTAAGSVVTLPAATGTGNKYKFLVTTLATSNSHIIYTDGGNSGSGTGVFKGIIFGVRVDSGNAVLGFASSSNDTITLNRTTTGSVTLGEWIEVIDIAANVWHVRGFLSATGGAFATPFSTT